MANSYAPISASDSTSQQPNVSVYAYLEDPLQTLNQVYYLDAYMLDNCAALEGLLQADHLHTVFTDKPLFSKLLTNILC